MGQIFRGASATAALLLCAATPAMASPWGQPEGEWLSIFKFDYYDTGREDGRQFRQSAFQYYSEHGFGGNWTLGGKTASAYQRITASPYEDERFGMTEAEFFAQRAVPTVDGEALALRLTYAFPTGSQSFLYDDEIQGRDAAIELAGLWGGSEGHTFVATKLGGRASLGDDADELRFDMTLGRHAGERRMWLFDIHSTLSVTDADNDRGTDYDLVTVAPSFVTPINKRFRLQIGARADIWGDGLDTGTGAFLALWVE